jgi:hypothetical protein
VSGSQPERLTIMKDMFNAEAWGRWYEAWSLSDEEEMDTSVCLDVFETMRLDEDGEQVWVQKYCWTCGTAEGGSCTCWLDSTRIPNVCGVGERDAERFGDPPVCSKGDRLPPGAKAWAKGLPDECFDRALRYEHIGCTCHFRHRGCVVVAFLAEGKRRGWWS